MLAIGKCAIKIDWNLQQASSQFFMLYFTIMKNRSILLRPYVLVLLETPNFLAAVLWNLPALFVKCLQHAYCHGITCNAECSWHFFTQLFDGFYRQPVAFLYRKRAANKNHFFI